jgi:SAM-dependent methyltransferase
MDYIKVNKTAWDKRTLVHMASKFYDVEAFIQGACSLNQIELDEVGCVEGKTLLHLQCHFGQDTLSWRRLGAKVTGVDLSSQAITQAKLLAQRVKQDAHFIEQDIYAFGLNNTTQFDFVFTSYGALCWLPDLNRWAQTIASALKPGGQFNLVEFHSVNDLLSGYSYFSQTEPDVDEEGTYTENCTGETSTMMTWGHALSEVINALINAGIQIESVNEFPFSPYECFEGLEFVEGKGYQMLHRGQQVPLLYSIKGRKL